MKKKNRIITIASVLIILIACGPSMQIDFDYDKATDFNRYKSYAWLTEDTPLNIEDGLVMLVLPGDEVKAQVDAGLKKKGYSLNYENPEFLVLVHLGLNQKVDVTDKGGKDYGEGKLKVEVEAHPEGTVFLDIIDFNSLNLVWRGTATKETEDKPTKETAKKNIEKALDKILDGFPPE